MFYEWQFVLVRWDNMTIFKAPISIRSNKPEASSIGRIVQVTTNHTWSQCLWLEPPDPSILVLVTNNPLWITEWGHMKCTMMLINRATPPQNIYPIILCLLSSYYKPGPARQTIFVLHIFEKFCLDYFIHHPSTPLYFTKKVSKWFCSWWLQQAIVSIVLLVGGSLHFKTEFQRKQSHSMFLTFCLELEVSFGSRIHVS